MEIASLLDNLELEALKLINYCLTCFLKYYHADSDYGTLRPKVYIKTRQNCNLVKISMHCEAALVVGAFGLCGTHTNYGHMKAKFKSQSQINI